jgi:hypothetical protein
MWKVGIGKILIGRTVPNGEDILQISHWMASEHRTSETQRQTSK